MYFAEIDDETNAYKKLKSLVQIKTVYVYMNAIKSIALRISDMTDSELLHAFVWGLKDKIKAKMRLIDPNKLTESIKMGK